jgi:hypothetical protein
LKLSKDWRKWHRHRNGERLKCKTNSNHSPWNSTPLLRN